MSTLLDMRVRSTVYYMPVEKHCDVRSRILLYFVALLSTFYFFIIFFLFVLFYSYFIFFLPKKNKSRGRSLLLTMRSNTEGRRKARVNVVAGTSIIN